MELITIKVVDTAIEAHILKNRLDGENIASYIFDENIVTLNPMLNFAVGGIKVKVPKQDYSKAKNILLELDQTPYTDNEDNIIKCPNCESQSFYSDFKSMKDPKGFFAMIAAFALTAFPIYAKSVYKCKECGTEFEKNSNAEQQGTS